MVDNLPKAGSTPVVVYALVGSDHGQDVGRVRDGSGHALYDLSVLQGRHQVHGRRKVVL